MDLKVIFYGLIVAMASTFAQPQAFARMHALNAFRPLPAIDTCSKSFAGGIKFSYCIFPSKDPKNKDIIIHLHGLGGSEETWKSKKEYRLIRQKVENMGRSLPTVVTVSLGRLWLMTEVNSRQNKYSVVTRQILPFVEMMAGFDGRGRRFLVGESMGGFNALQIFFRNPQTYAKVAILCPAVANLSPWSTEAEVKDYIQRTGAQSLRVQFFMKIAREEFPLPIDWDMHNPLLLANTRMTTKASIYMSADEKDEYGFQEGATLLHDLFARNFTDYQWETIVDGEHCDMNPIALAQFLTAP